MTKGVHMIDKFKQLLHDSGHSVTAVRTEVFMFLRDRGPINTRALTEGLPSIDRASIYRTLNLYRELDVIQDIVTGGRKMIELSDRFNAHHHHLSCTKCRATKIITDQLLEQYLNQLAKKNGYSPVSHQVEISGLCGECVESLEQEV